MRPYLPLVFGAMLFSNSAHAVDLSSISTGDLVISEVFPYPAAVLYNRGQWFEIYNNAGVEVDLNGLIVTNDDGETFTVNSSVVVAADDYALFAVRGNSSINGGVTGIDYVYAFSDLSLRVGGDGLTISFDGTTFDSMSYGTSYPDPFGASINLAPDQLDATSNDSASNWCSPTSTFGDGDYGTPGASNDNCAESLSSLTTGDLIVSEVLANPSASDYNKGEWFEIYNTSSTYVNLNGLVVSDGTESFTVTDNVDLRPGEYALFAPRTNAAVNGGMSNVDVRYIYGSDMTLATNDTIILSFGGTTFDSVTWTSGFPGSTGVAMELANTSLDATDNDSASNWCDALLSYGDGDLGSPGEANSDCDNDSDSDGFTEDVDCDDSDPNINPGATEVCNDIDDDCNGSIDDNPSDGNTYFADQDDDSYGDPDNSIVACSRPIQYRVVAFDCDDADAGINPSAVETCDGIDTNCSGDENDATDASLWYTDTDGDGYGDPGTETAACSQPSGTIADGNDCNDGDININPGATETCDGVDDNCSGDENDATDATTWYADIDDDKFGDPDNTQNACSRPSGYRPTNTDCDDADANINPGAIDLCDGIDDNCSGDESDADDAVTYYNDFDGDSYGATDDFLNACSQPSGYLVDNTDCDDTDGTINPAATETCDGVDDNCSGDENDATDATTYYADVDDDKFGDPDNTQNACERPSGYRPTNTDCDDADANINPGATDLCDGIDDNCSGDESDADDAVTYYADVDLDTYGDTFSFVSECSQPSGYVVDGSDCDDSNGAINPAAAETCDGVDDNCSGDENDASDATTYYADVDDDKYGDPDNTQNACERPSGYRPLNTDCDDSNAAINPGATDVCDGIDDNCSGDESDAEDAVTYYADFDSDGFGDPNNSLSACSQPSQYITEFTDCDDSTASTYPGAEETCNDTVDSDCDGNDSSSTCDATLDTSYAIIYGEASGDLMGYSVAAGDINGDGFDDILTGSRLDDDGGADAGAGYLFFGPISGSFDASVADSKMTGEAAGDYTGISLAAGDFNGDGFDDVLVGSLNESTTASSSGAVYIVNGPISADLGLASADAKWTGAAANDNAGRTVNSAGDFNGDGIEDIFVGADNDDTVDTNNGAAYLLYGPVTTDGTLTSADVIFTGAASQDRAGYWLDGPGDVNGDGNDDLFIGAYRADYITTDGTTTTTTRNTGAAYVVYGPASGTVDLSTADLIMYGEAESDQAASVIASAGDLNNDGYADLLVGARLADPDGNDAAGSVYLIYGSASLTGSGTLDNAAARFNGESAGDQAGRGIDGIGDVNSDGQGDLLIGAYKNSTNGTEAGASYLLLGPFTGTIGLSTADGLYLGEDASDQSGVSVYGGGDISGDGTNDILIGASSAGTTSSTGGLYLMLGEAW